MNVEQINWSKYSTIESLPDEVTIHVNRMVRIGGIIVACTFCIIAAIKITGMTMKIVMIGIILAIVINEISQLINRKFFFKISKKGIITPDNRIISWKQIQFVVIELKHRQNKVLLKKPYNPYPEELTIWDSNYSIQKVGHLIYMYQKNADETDSNSCSHQCKTTIL